MRLIEIGNERGVNRAPSHQFLRLRARSRTVDTKKLRDPTKMVGCLVLRLADDRQVQPAADYDSDVSNRYSLVCNPVIAGSR